MHNVKLATNLMSDVLCDCRLRCAVCAGLLYINLINEKSFVIILSPLLAAPSQSLRLIDMVRERIRVKPYSPRTELVDVK